MKHVFYGISPGTCKESMLSCFNFKLREGERGGFISPLHPCAQTFVQSGQKQV